jgi:hypothetical protein
MRDARSYRVALLCILLLPSLSGWVRAQRVGQLAELIASNGAAGDKFGYSVAVSGNTAVVGAPWALKNGDERGAAYVFVDSGSGWVQVAELTAVTFKELGTSVAIGDDGRTIAVGAPPGEVGGAVFIFVEPATGWADMMPTAELMPEHSVEDFGLSVAIGGGGSVVIAGSHGGGAFVYEEPATGWANTSEPTAVLAIPEGESYFGTSIAVSGNTVVVGDPYYRNSNGQLDGGAFVYILRSGPHTIPISATLTASTAGVADFGISVGISGNSIVAGANGTSSLAGAVYVFVKPAGGWTNMTQTAELTVPTSGETSLGYSVAIVGTTILAGAPVDTIDQNAIQGAAFGYVKPPDGWVDTSTPNLSVTGSDSTAGDEFGYALSFDGTTAVIGAPFHAVNGNADQGAAYVFGEQ